MFILFVLTMVGEAVKITKEFLVLGKMQKNSLRLNIDEGFS